MILVTGADGYVGASIVQKLNNQKEKTLLIMRNPPERLKVDKKLNKVIFIPDFFNLNVEDFQEIIGDCDCIYHPLWYANPKNYLNSEKNFDSMNATIKLAIAAKKNKLKYFIGFGSCLEYKKSDDIKTVNSELSAHSIYGMAKAVTFLTLNNYLKDSDTKFLWCRLFNIFGGSESKFRLSPTIFEAIKKKQKCTINNPDQIRDFMHIDDVVKNIFLLVDNNFEGAANICTGQPTKVSEFVQKIIEDEEKFKLIDFINKEAPDFHQNYLVGHPSKI